MSKSFSDVDWEPETPFGVLSELGFFPYSGADGDLFRKHGLAGWRVSVYGRTLIQIQEKGRRFRGRNTWNTRRRWEADNEEQLNQKTIAEFKQELAYLVDHSELKPQE